MSKSTNTIVSAAMRETSATGLHSLAGGLLDQMGQEKEQLYAVASAGYAYVDPGDITGRRLFEVIERLLEDDNVQEQLRQVIEELAQRAGSTLKSEQQEPHHA